MTKKKAGTFNQWSNEDQDWLMNKISKEEDLDSFYSEQDIADLLQAKPRSSLRFVVEMYKHHRADLSERDFLEWLFALKGPAKGSMEQSERHVRVKLSMESRTISDEPTLPAV